MQEVPLCMVLKRVVRRGVISAHKLQSARMSRGLREIHGAGSLNA